MFRGLCENAYIVCWVLASLLFCCGLVYCLVGVIIRQYGISLKLLLLGEEYIFALISSVLIFLIFSFPIALLVWIIVCFLMNCFFKNNRRLENCIVYFEQNKNVITSRQLKLLSQLNPYLTSARIALWIKDFQHLRKEALYKIDCGAHVNSFKHKQRIFPLSIFATGTIGITVSLLTYGHLVENSNLFLMLLLENYAILSCVLLSLYIFLYFSLVGNIFHYMYGHKRLFKIIFGVFSLIMYVSVTLISIGNLHI